MIRDFGGSDRNVGGQNIWTMQAHFYSMYWMDPIHAFFASILTLDSASIKDDHVSDNECTCFFLNIFLLQKDY